MLYSTWRVCRWSTFSLPPTQSHALDVCTSAPIVACTLYSCPQIQLNLCMHNLVIWKINIRPCMQLTPNILGQKKTNIFLTQHGNCAFTKPPPLTPHGGRRRVISAVPLDMLKVSQVININ